MTQEVPLILSDGTSSYIYGPGGLPIEQISSGGTVTYLHHDQQGSTRLLTGSTGTVTGSTTFDAYGNKTGSTGGSSTPLGYDGQYTSSDTGLIYMRARTYDPTTAQFLTVDPIAPLTRAEYNYAKDDPSNYADPSGLLFGIPGTPSTTEVVEGVLVKSLSRAAGAVATVASVVAAGCAVVAAPSGVGEVVCGAVGGVAVVSGGLATAGDTYLAAVGASRRDRRSSMRSVSVRGRLVRGLRASETRS
jgi:RHS repeat-associated protein